MRLRAVVVGIGVMACVACGSKHPPFIDNSMGSRGGSTASQGGSSNTEDTSVAGDSATPSRGGTVGVGSGSPGGPMTGKDGVVLPDRHGMFDGQQVYFAGISKDTIQLGDLFKYEYIVSPVLDPHIKYYGFSDQPGGVIVDKELLYWQDGDIYQYVSDAPQRSNPESNDILVPTPGCDAAEQVLDFVGSPEGRLLYACENQGLKYWEGDKVAYDGNTAILALGYGDLALIGLGKYGDAEMESPLNLLTLDDGVPAPVTGLPEQMHALEVRAQPDGFSVAVFIKDGDPIELWRIDSTGTAAQVGTYPAPPEGFDLYTDAMAADEARYLLGGLDEINVIVKTTVDGEATIIYREPADAQLLMGSYGKLASIISGP